MNARVNYVSITDISLAGDDTNYMPYLATNYINILDFFLATISTHESALVSSLVQEDQDFMITRLYSWTVPVDLNLINASLFGSKKVQFRRMFGSNAMLKHSKNK